MYIKPWMRFGSLFNGVLLSYVNHHTTWIETAHKKTWILLFCIMIFISCSMFAIIPYPFDASKWNVIFTLIFFTCSRTILTIGIAFYGVCCLGDSLLGKICSFFLSLKMWYPIAQLSYTMFLIHPIIIILIFTSNVLPVQWSIGIFACYALFFQFITALAAIPIYFLVEAPFMNMRIGSLENSDHKDDKSSSRDPAYIELQQQIA